MHRLVWIILAVLVLIAAHAAFFYYVSSHIAFSVVILSGVILLVAIKLIVIKHRGLSLPSHTLFRRRPRR